MSSLLDAKRNSIQTFEQNKVNITAWFQIRLLCFVLLDDQLFSIHSANARGNAEILHVAGEHLVLSCAVTRSRGSRKVNKNNLRRCIASIHSHN